MKKFGIMACIGIVLAMLLSSCASTKQVQHLSASPVIDHIVEKGELVVGTAASMPPFNLRSRSGEIVGYEIDLARYFAKALRVELRLEPMAFAELLPALKAGKVDMVMSGMTMTAERNMKVAFVGPYFITGKSFLTKLQTIATVEDPSEVNNPSWRFVALEGSTSQAFVEELLPDATFIPVRDYEEAIAMLRQNKVDALVADLPICALTALQYQDEGFIYLDTPMTYEPIGIAIPANDPLLVNWLENRLLTLEGSGVMEQLRSYWFSCCDWLVHLP